MRRPTFNIGGSALLLRNATAHDTFNSVRVLEIEQEQRRGTRKPDWKWTVVGFHRVCVIVSGKGDRYFYFRNS